MNSKLVIKLIEADGWYLVSTRGSHHKYKHPIRPGRVIVAHPKKDIPLGTVRQIEKAAGVKLRKR